MFEKSKETFADRFYGKLLRNVKFRVWLWKNRLRIIVLFLVFSFDVSVFFASSTKLTDLFFIGGFVEITNVIMFVLVHLWLMSAPHLRLGISEDKVCNYFRLYICKHPEGAAAVVLERGYEELIPSYQIQNMLYL